MHALIILLLLYRNKTRHCFEIYTHAAIFATHTQEAFYVVVHILLLICSFAFK